jgi:hypothetical protein
MPKQCLYIMVPQSTCGGPAEWPKW